MDWDKKIAKLDEEIRKKLHELIELHIDECDSKETPKLCEFRSTPQGREKLAKQIFLRVYEQKISVGQAMLDIELDFNPNHYE